MTAFTINSVFKNYGTQIPRASAWILRNPTLDADDPRRDVTIENCPARLVELHDYLKAGYQLVNDTQSIAGYNDTPLDNTGARSQDNEADSE